MSKRTRAEDAPDILRRELLRALSWGALAGAAGWSGRLLPAPPAEGSSVHRLRGEVLVNGRRITADAVIRSNDSIRTGSNSFLIATVGGNAYLLRENSVLEMSGDRAAQSLKLLAGKLMAVFGRKAPGTGYKIRTVTATVGIRGTGVYAEAYDDRTYLCTCYGNTELASVKNPEATERITSKHHDAPRWILAEPEQGRYIVPAAVNNHTDEEVETLNALVGRKGWDSAYPSYERPRREY